MVGMANIAFTGPFFVMSCSKLAKLSSRGSAYGRGPTATGDSRFVDFGLSGEGTAEAFEVLEEGIATGDGIVGGLSTGECLRAAGIVIVNGTLGAVDGPLVATGAAANCA